jgi:hypothetical protein
MSAVDDTRVLIARETVADVKERAAERKKSDYSELALSWRTRILLHSGSALFSEGDNERS